MKKLRFTAWVLAVLLLFSLPACGESKKGTVDFGDEDTPGETDTGVDVFTEGKEGDGETGGEYETFISVEDYDYTAETDSEILPADA